MTTIETSPSGASSTSTEPILRAENLTVEYKTARRKTVHAVDSINLTLHKGETLGLVGESGCGKSSAGKAIAQLPPPTRGHVWFDGVDLTKLSERQLRQTRRRLQLIFQDPISSLNPRRKAQDAVAEAIRIVGAKDADERALEVLASVGVDERMAERRPHELSGGQCQRISIARALIQDPEVLICDEPVSALDVSVQAQVLNLLEAMKAKYSLSLIFISHDLAVVKNISDRVVVMYLGKLCEIAPASDLYMSPRHHYTNLLLSTIPRPGREREKKTRTASEVGSSLVLPVGCHFAPRCPAASATCTTIDPPLEEIAPGHFVACHHPLEEGAFQAAYNAVPVEVRAPDGSRISSN